MGAERREAFPSGRSLGRLPKEGSDCGSLPPADHGPLSISQNLYLESGHNNDDDDNGTG